MPDRRTFRWIGVTALIVSIAILVAALGWEKSRPVRDPSLPPLGAFLVQLGTYESRIAAEEEFKIIQNLTGDLTTDYKVSIVEEERENERFYRLRLHPFLDLGNASSLCDKLVSLGIMCVPVEQRD